MTHPIVPPDAQPCIWMSAGLIRYRLCDRDFDCDCCPLDAALCGRAVLQRPTSPGARAGQPSTFPLDRVYGEGHTWLLAPAAGDGVVRVGLDGLAASLMAGAIGISCSLEGLWVRRGGMLCEIRLPGGTLGVRAPVAGRVAGRNPVLERDPGAVSADPYGSGWIVELGVAELADLEALMTAQQAEVRARHDLRRFRRRVAFHLLADAPATGVTQADGGVIVTDLRLVLGWERYVEAVRGIVG